MVIIRPVAETPHAAAVAAWLHAAWWAAEGHSLAATEVAVRAATGPAPPLTLVAERDGVPLGTASLTMEDLPERAELFPWLAGVWVQPECRGQGIARALVGRVEAAAAALGWARLHLYTGGAAGLYARLGWVATEMLARPGGTVTLMAKRL